MRPRAVTVRDAIRAAADYYSIDPALIESSCRSHRVVHARAVAVEVARGQGWGFLDLGRALSRDHSGLVRASVALRAEAEADVEVAKEIHHVTERARALCGLS